MSALDAAHPGFILFLGGLSLLWMAGMAETLRRRPERRLPWSWLALFGLGHGLSRWLDLLATQLPDPWAFQAFRAALVAGSWAALIEFGRQGVRRRRGRTLGRWLYLPLVPLAAAGGLSGGLSGLQTASQYALGLPGGLLAGLALLQASQRGGRLALAGLGLAALALMAYAPALALPFPALRAILPLAAMIGVWLYHRALGSLTARPSLLRRCALPAAFLLVVALGAAGTRWLEPNVDTEFEQVLVAGVAATEGTAGEPAAAPIQLEPAAAPIQLKPAAAPIQLKPANWDAVATKRQQLGLPVMLTILLLMAALIGIGAAAARS
jgi:hypothetical protein